MRLPLLTLALPCLLTIGIAAETPMKAHVGMVAMAQTSTSLIEPSASERILSIRRSLLELEKKGDLAELLYQARRAWDSGFRSAEIARFSASIAGRMEKVDEACLWLSRTLEVEPIDYDSLDNEQEPTDYDALMDDKDLAKVRSTSKFAEFLAKARSKAEQHRLQIKLGADLTKSTPSEAGLDPARLDALVKGAQDSHTSALIILRDGKLVGEWYFGGWSRRIEAMSASKSFVSLAVGLLKDENRIKSLDEPVFTYFPEWRQGRKERVTVRQLMNHTSGLQALRNTSDIYAAPDFVRLALSAELTEAPGSQYFYNNKAVILLPAIISKVAGKPMDLLLRERLFQPLGITDLEFQQDSVGNLHGMAGIRIHPLDLAKVGQLLLDGGTYHGKQLLSREWISESTGRPSQGFNNTNGLLWWLRYKEKYAVFPAGSIDTLLRSGWTREKISEMGIGENNPQPEEAFWKVWDIHLDDLIRMQNSLRAAGKSYQWSGRGGLVGFSAEGDLGNYLLVLPESRLVVVRMASSMGQVGGKIYFQDFFKLATDLGSTAR